MPRYRRIPMEFDAVQFMDDANRLIEISDMIGKDISVNYANNPPTLNIEIGDGWIENIPHKAYVMRTKTGYAWLSPKEFLSKYEPIN